ncbi:hypothetical protein ACOMHN_054211 [Nucella lapillus]
MQRRPPWIELSKMRGNGCHPSLDRPASRHCRIDLTMGSVFRGLKKPESANCSLAEDRAPSAGAGELPVPLVSIGKQT